MAHLKSVVPSAENIDQALFKKNIGRALLRSMLRCRVARTVRYFPPQRYSLDHSLRRFYGAEVSLDMLIEEDLVEFRKERHCLYISV